MTRLPGTYFDAVFDDWPDDPYRLGEWYNQRKYAITLAMLPNQRYKSCFEIGCSIGMLTELLVYRCDQITATDISERALQAAKKRLNGHPVRLLKHSIDDPWPEGDFDLVVISEVGFYLDFPDLSTLLDRELPRLGNDVTVVAAHWRHCVPDTTISGDEINEMICGRLHPIAGYRDDDVVIDVCNTTNPHSVAWRAGLT